ncbi:hypothetical protein IWQ62_006673, partial [Dispira parvispora]
MSSSKKPTTQPSGQGTPLAALNSSILVSQVSATPSTQTAALANPSGATSAPPRSTSTPLDSPCQVAWRSLHHSTPSPHHSPTLTVQTDGSPQRTWGTKPMFRQLSADANQTGNNLSPMSSKTSALQFTPRTSTDVDCQSPSTAGAGGSGGTGRPSDAVRLSPFQVVYPSPARPGPSQRLPYGVERSYSLDEERPSARNGESLGKSGREPMRPVRSFFKHLKHSLQLNSNNNGSQRWSSSSRSSSTTTPHSPLVPMGYPKPGYVPPSPSTIATSLTRRAHSRTASSTKSSIHSLQGVPPMLDTSPLGPDSSGDPPRMPHSAHPFGTSLKDNGSPSFNPLYTQLERCDLTRRNTSHYSPAPECPASGSDRSLVGESSRDR